MTKVKSELVTTLDNAGMSLNTSQKQLTDKVIENTINPFKEIGTRYLQDKYMQQHLHYLVSKYVCSMSANN